MSVAWFEILSTMQDLDAWNHPLLLAQQRCLHWQTPVLFSKSYSFIPRFRLTTNHEAFRLVDIYSNQPFLLQSICDAGEPANQN